MKQKSFLLVIVFLLVFLLSVSFVFLSSNQGVFANGVMPDHKVIFYADAFESSLSGLELWHDYGTYKLYKATEPALNALDAGGINQFQVVDEMDRLLLDVYPFDTQRETLDIPNPLEIEAYNGPGLYLIQFVGPIKADWLAEVEGYGVRLVHYIANNGYLVWADAHAMERLQPLVQDGDFLQFSGVYQPYFKVSQGLNERVVSLEDPDEVVHVVVQMYNHDGKAMTQDDILSRSQEQVVGWNSILAYENAEFRVRVGEIAAIANRPDVVWIGERLPRQLNDEVQGQIMAANFDGSMAGPSGPGYLAWLDSYGFSQNPADYPVVDITDDGIGNGTVNSGDYTLHQFGSLANPTRLAYVANCTNSSSGEGEDGHGHINVSIAGGYDNTTGSPYQDGDGFNRGLGINPYGRFGGTRIFDPGFDVSRCGGTDTGLIKSIQDSGAQISSHSWGCAGCASTYDDSSQAFDVGVRDADLSQPGNQEIIFVNSAGNNGPSSGTIGTPGNGKNMITVGASENDRATWTDGCGIGPSGADDAMDVISFSSRGPAPGGRVKPEVIAPGTHIQGTASTNPDYNGSGVCDAYQPVGQIIFAASSGTSHSTPAVSGAASLYWYWLEQQYEITPTPALMKAYLVAHPTYLTGLYANDTLPSNVQGYGMPDMTTALDDTPRFMVNQTVIFDNSGETWTFSGTVAESDKPVRIVMAYTDKAGAIGTNPQVNNLNLSAVVDGSTYLGNHFSGQWSITGGSPDTANNYEAIFLPAGTSGDLEITITGFNIADDGIPNFGDGTDQDFALVCYNCAEAIGFSLEVTPESQQVCTPGEGQYDVLIGQVGGFSDPVTLSAQGNPAGTTASFSVNPVLPPGSSVLTIGNTGAASPGNYSVDVVGTASAGTITRTVNFDLFTAVPGSPTLLSPPDGSLDQPLAPTFQWSAVNQAVSYTLEVAEDAGFSNIIYSEVFSGTSHELGIGLDPDTVYYWRVTAANPCGNGVASSTFQFRTADVRVLLVDDDDNAPDVQSTYTGALAGLEVPYDLWDTANSDSEPDLEKLNPYDIVIWFSGDENGGFAGPGSDGEAALGSWLDSGGRCFFISSQDYEKDRDVTAFMADYLGVSSISEPIFFKTEEVTGNGSVFSGLGPYDLSYPFTNYADTVSPDGTAETAFLDNRDRSSGINKTSELYKTTYWGFPFEAIPTQAEREEVLEIFLNWCGIPSYEVYIPLVIR